MLFTQLPPETGFSTPNAESDEEVKYSVVLSTVVRYGYR